MFHQKTHEAHQQITGPFSFIVTHHGYVRGVKDLCAVWQCDGPQLWCWVQDLAPSLGQVDSRSILLSYQIHDSHRAILGLEHIVNSLAIFVYDFWFYLKVI